MQLRAVRSILAILVATAGPLQAAAAAQTVVSWAMRSAADAWAAQPSGPVPLVLPGGAGLRYPPWPRPYVLVSPDFDLPATTFQVIDLTITAPPTATLGLSWVGRRPSGRDAVGRFVPLPGGDGVSPCACTVEPHWQDFTRVRSLQIAVPADTPWTIVRATISDPQPGMAVAQHTLWGTPEECARWLPLRGLVDVHSTPDALVATLSAADAVLISPPLDAPASEIGWYGATVTAEGLQSIGLYWACDGGPGLQGEDFDVPDGARHVYNSRLAGATGWRGCVRGLAVALRGRPGAKVALHLAGLGKLPLGPPDLRCHFFGVIDPLPRAGRPLQLTWVGENHGGEAATSVSAQPGAAVPLPARRSACLDPGVPQAWTWDLGAYGPGGLRATATLSSANLAPVVSAAETEVTPLVVPVPPVAAVAPSVTLAAVFCAPQRLSWERPDDTRRYARRPVLGDYAADDDRTWPWHIRWAATHGITTFIFEVRVAGAAVSQDDIDALAAYLRAGKPSAMRWCIRIDTGTRPSATAVGAVLKRLQSELGREDYLRSGGMPVVLVARAGISSTALADLSAVSEAARQAGRPGICLIACAEADALTAEAVRRSGFCAVSDADDEVALQRRGDVDAAVEPLERSWRAATAAGLTVVPNLAAGFDARRPASLARLGFLCQLAERQAAATPAAEPRLVIVGTWNRSEAPLCLEPRRGTLFAPLDAVRRIFCREPAHADCVPADAGEGPFDRPVPQPPTQWTFDTPGFTDSWDMAMGFDGLDVLGGELRAVTVADEAAVFGGRTRLDARDFDTVRLCLSATAGRRARLAWETNLQPLCAANSVPFALQADGQPHEVTLRLGLMPGWRGLVTGFRLDPADTKGAHIALDYLKVTHELD